MPTKSQQMEEDNPGLTPITGDSLQRMQTVRVNFSDMNDLELAWVADNFDMISDSPALRLSDGRMVVLYVTRVNMHAPMQARYGLGTLDESVRIIYSVDADPLGLPGVDATRGHRPFVRWAEVVDPYFRQRMRCERIGAVLSPPPPLMPAGWRVAGGGAPDPNI